MNKLCGKVSVVTGPSKGIGASIASISRQKALPPFSVIRATTRLRQTCCLHSSLHKNLVHARFA